MNEKPMLVLRTKKTKAKAAVMLVAALIVAGLLTLGALVATGSMDLPVIVAGGEFIKPPWYVTVEGKKVALVESEEKAKAVIKEVADSYKNDKTINIKIKEKTAPQEMNLGFGDAKPRIASVKKAVKAVKAEGSLTVVTGEIITKKEKIPFKRADKKTKKLFTGQTKVKTEGEIGLKKVTAEVIKENGKAVKSHTTNTEILKESQTEIILTGIKPLPQQPQNGEHIQTASRGVAARGMSEGGLGTEKPSTMTNGENLAKPVSSIRITSSFGPRWGRIHSGVDLGMPTGTPIHAAKSGTVISAGYSGSYGNLIKIDHGDNMVTYYAHCSKIIAQNGQKVSRGQTIAKVGSTGNSTGPHLHFEVRIGNAPVNPMNYL
ncbi:MAG: peptidoglycan DD-metalloendopeptidase family protein [Anaerovoracaceae bacterium]